MVNAYQGSKTKRRALLENCNRDRSEKLGVLYQHVFGNDDPIILYFRCVNFLSTSPENPSRCDSACFFKCHTSETAA